MKNKQDKIRRPPRQAFTLIELLVVLAIIAILAGVLLPAASHVYRSGQASGCASNCRQLATALIAFDSDFQFMPWLNEGYYKDMNDANGTKTNSQFIGTNWEYKLRLFKYIPNTPMAGVERCPSASYAEITGKDTSGNPANYGGYGVSADIFRNQNNSLNVQQRPLLLSRIPRPDRIWLVGDCGRPMQNSVPGSGKYLRTASSWNRPSSIGNWDFTSSYTAPSPAMRHEGQAVFSAFDGHATRMDVPYLKGETNNFTARGETI